jgi:hypothetical protein
MQMRILYVTTFNLKIWNASAKAMTESFFKSGTEGDLLLCHEGFKFDPKSPKHITSRKVREKEQGRIRVYDLDKDSYLQNWLKENADVIPPEMGGTANKKKKPQAYLPWNFRAAGWFRKIATLNYALKTYGNEYDAIIFLDADSTITKKMTTSLISKVFGKYSFFYHWGRERPKKGLGVESGFIGFKMDKVGKHALEEWIGKYKDGIFRRYMMWDDGGMFGNVVLELKERENIVGHDLVTDYKENGKSQSHVIERGMLAEYFVHNKGLHKRLGVTHVK